MLRQLIAILITCFAIAFAFGALTAVRWPSIMMAVSWLAHDQLADGLATVNWRQLGIDNGGPYLLAALCFYCSAAMVAARRRGGVAWYLCGMGAGFPVFYLVTFEPGWWENPSIAEGGVAGLGAVGVLLLIAVWELRYRPARPVEQAEAQPEEVRQPVVQTIVVQQSAEGEEPIVVRKHVFGQPKTRPGFVPAAVARQRASFAHHGRKAAARRQKVLEARGLA
ncbi:MULTISPECIES: hypothetical protein [unclassified Hyphomonas]|jgi:hypothetical protein|uniref:hypothetical protein n=1 Tax=unclassified Hyphomonas TaxID=2630699 RepID=UPI0004591A00|nr:MULTISPECIES: hypothetical protein [unclassified Hyphomonas]KCZ49787.1 hypothetical protein HY17_01440 [Hyphomonas sp. CY54-11-8]RAN39650.1 hypothetical protein HY26_15275 [Hyphomonas sp. GM-8P]